jgi:hypothetical protein
MADWYFLYSRAGCLMSAMSRLRSATRAHTDAQVAGPN